jgi:ubiquinone biosynthesis protein UbiJ
MATQSPFPFGSSFPLPLGPLFERLGEHLRPPAWLVDEVQHRAVLFANHVLMQEPAATARLARQKGRVALVQWRGFSARIEITPAGLLDRAAPHAVPDLTLTVAETSPLDLARTALRGDKPAVRIEGDVQFAADINWLVDHVRWDVEEDLARVIGDAPAHTAAQAGRRVAEALRRFVGDRMAARAAAGGGGATDSEA